eukprot:1158203-Pelagomonas_calceolata.AAC.6
MLVRETPQSVPAFGYCAWRRIGLGLGRSEPPCLPCCAHFEAQTLAERGSGLRVQPWSGSTSVDHTPSRNYVQ